MQKLTKHDRAVLLRAVARERAYLKRRKEVLSVHTSYPKVGYLAVLTVVWAGRSIWVERVVFSYPNGFPGHEIVDIPQETLDSLKSLSYHRGRVVR